MLLSAHLNSKGYNRSDKGAFRVTLSDHEVEASGFIWL